MLGILGGEGKQENKNEVQEMENYGAEAGSAVKLLEELFSIHHPYRDKDAARPALFHLNFRFQRIDMKRVHGQSVQFFHFHSTCLQPVRHISSCCFSVCCSL